MGMGQESAIGPMGGASSSQMGPGGNDILTKLAGLLKDPEVVKALGGFASSVGSTMSAGQKIPPHAREMIAQAMQQAQSKRSTGLQDNPDTLNPYGGDMSKFITPDMARGVLDSMGIPYGKMRMLQ